MITKEFHLLSSVMWRRLASQQKNTITSRRYVIPLRVHISYYIHSCMPNVRIVQQAML